MLDYWGIAVLILGSTFPYVSYRYACGQFIVYRYIIMSIIGFLTFMCMWVTMHESMLNPINKVILYTIFGAACMVPIIGLQYWYDPLNTLEPDIGLYLYSLICYIVGMLMYGFKIPERFIKKGKLDYLGSSHQIFHTMVLIGVFLTFFESLKTYHARLEFQCPD